jgi:hypothetical protein
MFADEARFGRMNRPRPCWAPTGIRPEVAAQLIREYIYLYGAVCPKDGKCGMYLDATLDEASIRSVASRRLMLAIGRLRHFGKTLYSRSRFAS